MKKKSLSSSKFSKLSVGVLAAAVVASVPTAGVFAATTATSTLEQVITAGALSTEFQDAGGATVSNPTVPLTTLAQSSAVQTSTGTFGTTSNRVVIDNPGAALNGWTLTLNATNPSTALWSNGTQTFDYKGTTATGQLSINGATATYTALNGTSTGITVGTGGTFSASTVAGGLTLAQGDGTNDVTKGYVAGYGVQQSIPAGQAAGTYTIQMTQTLTAA